MDRRHPNTEGQRRPQVGDPSSVRLLSNSRTCAGARHRGEPFRASLRPHPQSSPTGTLDEDLPTS